jgi:tetratricopeptide (TPR) repeat protein
MLLMVLLLSTGAPACGELRGRRRIREGNRLYREGQYASALAEYQRAEALVPQLPLLWLNKGLTCRQLMVPGAKDARSERAVDCAVAAFARFKEVAPHDLRGEQLEVQTLFDADRFETLAARYHERLKVMPEDLAAINGLIQVCTRWNRPEEALGWYQRRASLLPNDAEVHHAVGVYVWQQLFQRGGGPDKTAHDPRPGAAVEPPPPPTRKGGRGRRPAPAVAPPAPVFAIGDITGQTRLAMADVGIKHLERAIALRPHHRETMVYLGLVLRQRAVALWAQPAAWQAVVDAAERWRRRAAGEAALAAGEAPPATPAGAAAAPAPAARKRSGVAGKRDGGDQKGATSRRAH